MNVSGRLTSNETAFFMKIQGSPLYISVTFVSSSLNLLLIMFHVRPLLPDGRPILMKTEYK